MPHSQTLAFFVPTNQKSPIEENKVRNEARFTCGKNGMNHRGTLDAKIILNKLKQKD